MLTAALVGVAAVGGFGAVRLTLGESQSQRFTEFAMVGPSGTLKDLPATLAPGGLLQIRLMVTNHENGPVGYEIRPMLDGQPLQPVEAGTLADGEEWNEPYTVAAPTTTGAHELAFDLERIDATGAYRHLSLKFAVSAPSPEPTPGPTATPSQP